MTTATMTKTRAAKRATARPRTVAQTRSGGKNKGRDPEDETAYLLKNPANAEHLRQAIADLDAGKGIEVDLEDL